MDRRLLVNRLTAFVNAAIYWNMAETRNKTMIRVQQLFEKSGLTLDDLGQRMGYSAPNARQSAWQFVTRTDDPRLSMLEKFAAAIGVSVAELFIEKKKGRSK